MANKRIQDLPIVPSIDGSEEMPINKGGITNKATVDQIKNHFSETFEPSSNKETTALSDSATKYPSSKVVLREFDSLIDGSTKTLSEIENDYNRKIREVAKRNVDFVTDNATTRLQILESDRIKNFMLSYNGKTETFFGSTFDDASWVDDANWKTFTYDVAGYSFLSNTEIAKLASYPLIPNDSARFLRGDGVFESIALGSGGYASNVYLSNVASNIAGYKTLSYTNDANTTTISGASSNNNVVLIEEFAYPLALGITVLDAGSWKFILNGKVSSAANETYARIGVYSRSTSNVETLLFTVDSLEINSLVDDNIVFETIQPMFNVSATDRIVIKLYVLSTSPVNKTLTVNLGGTKASYMNTPVAIRHSQLRGLNDDANVQHMTSLEKSALGAVKTKTVIFTTDVPTTRKLVTLAERVNGYKLTYSNKTEQYIGSTFTDTEWVKDSNWTTFEMLSSKNVANGYAGLDAAKKLANDIIRTDFRMSQGYIFDGVNDYLTVAHNDKLNFGTDDFSIQVLAYINLSSNIERIIYKNGTAPNYVGFSLKKTSNNILTFSITTFDSSIKVYESNYTLTSSGNYSIIATRGNGNISLYVNGILVSSNIEANINSVNNNEPLLVGQNANTLEKFVGKVSLVRLFNRALSQSDVTYYENGGRPGLQRLKYEDKGARTVPTIIFDGTFKFIETNYGNGTSVLMTDEAERYYRATPYANNDTTQYRLLTTATYETQYVSLYIRQNSGSSVNVLYYNQGSSAAIKFLSLQSGVWTKIEFISNNKPGPPIAFIVGISGSAGVPLDYKNLYVKTLGCVLELLPENALPDRWLESQNGLDAITSGNPAINTETSITNMQIVDNITNNIAIGVTNRDYTLPAGYLVDSVCVKSTVTLTALQLVNVSTSETLLTGKTVSSAAGKHLPITADQSSPTTSTTLRLNTNGNTGLGFNIVINLKRCL